jgi:5-methyltetrahydropteroyltriglutamate--homocysteine methyltransferase
MNHYFNQKEILWEPYIAQAVNDMVAAEIKMVSDGQTRDPFIQLFTRKLTGCRVRDRTEIIGNIEYNGPITVPDQQYIRRLISRETQIVGVLTGPYTLTKSCVDLFYNDEQKLAFDFATALKQEATLLQNHVDLISIDEPFFSNEMPPYGNELIQEIVKDLTCPTRLHVCGDVTNTIPYLVEMPVNVLSHEFKASPHLFNAFAEYGCPQDICLGSVRSDDTRIEPIKEIQDHIQRGIEVFGDQIVQLAPDCGQRLLPRDVAFQKLQHLVQAGERCYG